MALGARDVGAWVWGRVPALVLVLVVGVAVGVPGVGVVVGVVDGLAGEGGRAGLEAAAIDGAGWRRLGVTVGVAGLIGVLAMGFGAWPAWLAARRGAWWHGVFLTPLLLPTTLAYAGWNSVRGPGTWMAGWLEGLARDGWPDAPVWAGWVLAVLGLALWGWPLAMLGAGAWFARVPTEVLEDLRITTRGWRGVAARVRLVWPGLAMGAGLVALVMLGSAVPLHLAQVETDAIRLWRLLNETGAGMRWAVWIGAWPTVAAAVVGGVWLARAIARDDGDVGRAGDAGGRASKWMVATAAVAVVLGVGVPLVLFAAMLREPESLWTFWRLHGEGVRSSVAIGAMVGAAGACITLCVAMGWESARRLTGVCVGVLLVGALLPGVLVGSGTLAAWSWIGADWVTQTAVISVVTHVARFGAVAAVAGVWVARGEGRAVREQRRMEGSGGWWWRVRTAGAVVWLVAGGVGVGMVLLSVHEVESAVIVQPAGVENLARHLLSLLHFQRDEELAAASVWLIGGGLVPAVVGGVGVWGAWSAVQRRGSNGE